jgi:hypothetical protein
MMQIISIGRACGTTDGSRKRGLGVGVGTSSLRVALCEIRIRIKKISHSTLPENYNGTEFQKNRMWDYIMA